MRAVISLSPFSCSRAERMVCLSISAMGTMPLRGDAGMAAMAVAVLQLRRQVGGVDDGAGGESTGTFQAILELADVAGPVISHHHAHGVFADGALEAGGAIDAIEKMFDQHRNVSF